MKKSFIRNLSFHNDPSTYWPPLTGREFKCESEKQTVGENIIMITQLLSQKRVITVDRHVTDAD